MFKLIHEFFSPIFHTSTQIVIIFFLYFIYVAVAYGWSTQEHREMVPHRDDFDLSHEQFNVGTGDIFTGERDRWRYAHLLVAADFFQNWTDFRNSSRTIVIDARKTIDQNNQGSTLGNSNHDLITVLRGNINFTDVLANNRDHFQPYAQRRWRNMHTEAINMAGGSLKGALTYNGFADHFLADTFAAGHQIDYEKIRRESPPLEGRDRVKKKHDRLSKDGLQAQNDRGDQWFMLGDGYFHTMEQKGQDITIEAIALSIDDIFLAASGKNVPVINGKYRAELLIPHQNYDDVIDTSVPRTGPTPPINDTDMTRTFEPKPALAKLIVRSNLDGDQVYIDSKNYGSTRVDVELEAGQHNIVVSKHGYRPYEKVIEMVPGEQQTIWARLEKRSNRISFDGLEYNCSSLAKRIGDFIRELPDDAIYDIANAITGSSLPRDLSKFEFEPGHKVSGMNVLICIDKSFPSTQKTEFVQETLSYLAIGEYEEGKCNIGAERNFRKIFNKSGDPMPIFLTFDSKDYGSGTARAAYSGGIKERGYMQIHTNRLDFSPFSRGIQSNIFSYDETDDDYSHSVSCLCLLDHPHSQVINCNNR